MKKLSLYILTSTLILASCVSQPDRIYTSSGKPEIMTSAPLEIIKDAVIGVFAADAWVITNDSNYSTTMTKPCGDGFGCIMGQALIGNSYSTPPQMEISISWIETYNGNKVMVSRYDLSTQMAFGQVNRQTLLGNNTNFNQLVDLLNKVKRKIEDDNPILIDNENSST